VAVIADALTDNRTRTAGDVRLIFGKYGGNLGTSGCVSYMFDHKGRINVPSVGVSEDRLMELSLEAGALDVASPDEPGGAWLVTTGPMEFLAVKSALEAAGVTIADAALDMIPTTTVTVGGEDARSLIKLVDALEDNDDVQKVYANFEVPDEELAAMD